MSNRRSLNYLASEFTRRLIAERDSVLTHEKSLGSLRFAVVLSSAIPISIFRLMKRETVLATPMY